MASHDQVRDTLRFLALSTPAMPAGRFARVEQPAQNLHLASIRLPGNLSSLATKRQEPAHPEE